MRDCFRNETYLSLLLSDDRCGGIPNVAISSHQAAAFSRFEQKFIRRSTHLSADSLGWGKCNFGPILIKAVVGNFKILMKYSM